MKYITRSIWLLSLLSLFTDISSEMLYPIMPLFLKSIGFSAFMIGLLEGLAEAVAGISKGYFGTLSDSFRKRLPFVQWGYFLSAISKPMMTLFSFPLWIFSARTMDRIGKGIRTGARDALLSDDCTPENKGKVFGFHRSMDTLGAAIGPFIALIFLYFYPEQYQLIFLVAFAPAILGILLTFFIKEKEITKAPEKRNYSFLAMFEYFKTAPANYRKMVIGFLLFALFNSSDIFLLMKVKESLADEKYVIGAYIFYNLVYALSSFPIGILGDKIGLNKMYLIGLILFAVVYISLSISTSIPFIFCAFVLYGVYAAATEGISKAMVSNTIPKNESASALGSFAGLTSLSSFFASAITGLIWTYVSPTAALITCALGAIVALLYFIQLTYTHTTSN
jgi:MFS family permease